MFGAGRLPLWRRSGGFRKLSISGFRWAQSVGETGALATALETYRAPYRRWAPFSLRICFRNARFPCFRRGSTSAAAAAARSTRPRNASFAQTMAPSVRPQGGILRKIGRPRFISFSRWAHFAWRPKLSYGARRMRRSAPCPAFRGAPTQAEVDDPSD